MSFYRIIFTTCVCLTSLSWASPVTQTPSRIIGLDFALPYIFTVDGNSFNDPDHKDVGLYFHHFVSNNVSFGARFAVDIEEDTGRFRQWVVAPGVMYQWFQGQTWMPYVRFDFPVLLKGAFNSNNSSSQSDTGFIAGFGLAWNIGNQMGLKNLLLTYDFTAQYYFGFGKALGNFGIEFAKFGLEYRF